MRTHRCIFELGIDLPSRMPNDVRRTTYDVRRGVCGQAAGRRGKGLTANHAGVWRYRAGDYRILAQLIDKFRTAWLCALAIDVTCTEPPGRTRRHATASRVGREG